MVVHLELCLWQGWLHWLHLSAVSLFVLHLDIHEDNATQDTELVLVTITIIVRIISQYLVTKIQIQKMQLCFLEVKNQKSFSR